MKYAPGIAFMVAAATFSSTLHAAGAAYQVDTAEVSETGSCKIESWFSTSSERDYIATVSPSCVADLSRPVEVAVQLSRSRSDNESATAVAPRLKTNLVPSAIGKFGIAAAAGLSYDFTARETSGAFAYVPTTLRLSNVVRINLNGGWQWDQRAGSHYATYGAGADWRTPDNVWTLTGEVFGQGGAPAAASENRPRFQLGLRFRPVGRFNIDLIYGRNLTGENANWLTLATIIRFP